MCALWRRTFYWLASLYLLEVQSRDVPHVNIPGQGIVEGKEVAVTRSQRASVYLGIPFAAPPLKLLRFAPPVTRPLPTWNTPRNATEFAPACIQNEDDLKKHDRLFQQLLPEQAIKFSEDCLYLNVFVPDGSPPSEGWPVMVWLHPGDFNTGATAWWDGSVLAIKQKVIVVTTAYRLNIFGFLTLMDGCPGNLGLLDQVAALDWVSTKIAVFGGSSENVCVFGHGAGGSSVGLHVLSPLSAGKFHKALAMSGSALKPGIIKDPEIQEMFANKLGSSFGCTKSILLDCLRNLNADPLLKEANKIGTWGPVVDRDLANVSQAFLPKEPISLLEEGRFNKVPFMVGYTNMEDALEFEDETVNFDQGISIDSFESLMLDAIDKELQPSDVNDSCSVKPEYILETIMFFYSPEPQTLDMTQLRQRYIDYTTEKRYGAGAYQQAIHTSKFRPTFLYRFDYKPKRSIIDVPEWVRVPHQFELPFVWGMPYWPMLSTQIVWNNSDKKITDIIMNFWSNFAKFANPAQNSMNIKWEQFSEENPGIMILDRNFNVSDSTSFNFKSFSFWNSYYPKVVDASRLCCNNTDTSSQITSSYVTFAILAGANYLLIR